jgi:CHAT domain-containing protein/Tfp pilus assembly protein PilF
MRGFVFFAVACLALARPVHAQSSSGAAGHPQSEITFLELGKPIEREMRGGEKHSYKVHAEAGQFVRVVAMQKGIDVSVTLLDPRGKQLLIVDSMNGSYGPEPVSIVAEDSGDLQLDVSTSSTDVPAGHYQIQLTDLRTPAQTDRNRIGAERTYAEGCLLYSRGGAESAGAAAAKWQESFALWQSLDDKYGQALSLSSIGSVYSALGEKQKELDYYNQALPLQRAVGDRAGEAATLKNIGLVYDTLGQMRKALDYFNQALPLERAVGDRAGEAGSLNNIGEVYGDLGEMQKALDYLNQALPLLRAVGDRRGEAVTLSNVGAVYDALGEKQKALDYLNQALPLRRAVGDREGEAVTLSNVGAVYDDLGEKQKALDYYNQALPLRRAVGDRAGEAATLNNIGLVYHALGEKQKALDYYSQALPLQRAVRDRSGEANTLSNIGGVYHTLREMRKALDYYNQALPLRRAVGDRSGEATTLNNIGGVYSDLGEKQKALDYYNQALPLRRAVGDRSGEAGSLSDIGWVYSALGEKQKALDYYNQALPLRRAVGDRAGEAATLNNIGRAHADLEEKQKALDYYNQALPLSRAVGDRAHEAITLKNIGAVYDKLGEKQKALDYYNQSLPLSRAVQDPLGEASTLVLLMEHWKSLRNPSLAVLFGKQAIDRFQQVRRNIGGLEKEAQQSFLKSKEDYYRELAEVLISEGRLPEAQQVLDLLKAEEYSEFTQRRGETGSETNPVALTPGEEKSNKEYERITGEITATGGEWTQLHAKPSRSADEEHRYNELSDRLTAANQQLQAFLKTLYVSFGKGDQANARVQTIDEQTAGLQTLVGELGTGTAAVYTLVLEQKCVMMVTTPATRVAREVPIGRIALRGKVFAFARSLAGHDSEEDILPKAQDLYNVLVAPIEKDLQGAQAKTLVWSLDDVLRYVPLAALYDGKQYLVERYRNVVITTASVGNLKDQPQVGSWRGVAMGVSRDYDGLGKLEAVPDELDSVVRSDKVPGSHGPVPGTILLDDSFTETGMESALDQHPSLVHIASHYVFQVGDDTKSYLLLGGKNAGGHGFHLTLADLRDDQRMDFKGIELLTLSGCQTAVGSNDSDGREIDGLGITAQRKGAKAVVATLWAVDDASVGLLMATFYKLWVTTPGITKAEALQQAQLALLHGTADPAATRASKQRIASTYANPYYWAPFILIGNWK